MKVVITGGAGFLGSRLARALLERGTLAGPEGSAAEIGELVLFDRVAPEPALEDARVRVVTGDVADRETLSGLIDSGTASVFHLAAVVSGEAEEDFDLGMRVNLEGTLAVLEACRALSHAPRVVFTSSVAAFGGELPDVIEDGTPLNPQTSYGSQKAMAEFLVTDYSRKGFIDGRALRLPTIAVRPGKPNRAASGFASGIIREPLGGQPFACPVSPDARMWVLSPRRAVAAFLHAHDMTPEAWGANRVLNLPGLSVSMAEAVASLRRLAGDEVADRVTFEPDPTIQGFVSGWPNDFSPTRALNLGFEGDQSMDEIVGAFIEDDLGGKAG